MIYAKLLKHKLFSWLLLFVALLWAFKKTQFLKLVKIYFITVQDKTASIKNNTMHDAHALNQRMYVYKKLFGKILRIQHLKAWKSFTFFKWKH